MGIIAWIAVGLTAGLLANMLLRGKRSRALFHLPDLLHRDIGGAWPPASSAWTASSASPPGLSAIAEAAVLLLACHLLTRLSGWPGGFTRRWDIQEGSP